MEVGGWCALAIAAIFLVWQVCAAPDDHIRALIIGVSGALSLVIPPARQAFRNYVFRNSPPERGVVPADVSNAILMRKLKTFTEFSWWDVVFFVLGPVLLSIGCLLDVTHDLHEKACKAAEASGRKPPIDCQ